jgi:hypothetical protein
MASYIARRKFLATLLGGAAVAWPLRARGQQQPTKLARIGFLRGAGPDDKLFTAFMSSPPNSSLSSISKQRERLD